MFKKRLFLILLVAFSLQLLSAQSKPLLIKAASASAKIKDGDKIKVVCEKPPSVSRHF